MTHYRARLIFFGAICLMLTSETGMAKMYFMDTDFAKKVCDAWNQSALPDMMKRGKSGFLDSRGGKGKQECVVHRKECVNVKPVVFHVEADSQGRAVCTQAGWFSGTTPQGTGHWKIDPSTIKWIKWSDGFGFFDVPGILPGFEGDYPMALSLLSDFELFFALSNHLAETNNVEWECAEANTDIDQRLLGDIKETVAKVNKKDRETILAKGKWNGNNAAQDTQKASVQ